MHVGCGMTQVAKSRRFETSDGTVQEHCIGQRAGLLIVAEYGPYLHLRSRHVIVAKDIPHSQIRQRGTGRWNRSEAFARRGMLFGGRKVVGCSGGKGRNR